jgi:HD-GYP domain-containing protein (c-di-GMP phosphodiesterase class II)
MGPLGMMFDQVAIAYENSCRLEKQSGRTLGLVHSLISMIENNTLSRGTTEMVMDFTYAVAVRMHYPEEHLRDLLYGTVLRDIGMLNMSNYIVRSPRELVQEEWEIIKQHTIEGAATLERMGFSEHACSIVRSHHERYNGEGYPDGLTGPLIPLGARILSVVESYSAMLHDRPNRPALTADEALNTLEENWGLRYDPEVVKVFSQTLEEDARAGGKGRPRGIDLIKG